MLWPAYVTHATGDDVRYFTILGDKKEQCAHSTQIFPFTCYEKNAELKVIIRKILKC